MIKYDNNSPLIKGDWYHGKGGCFVQYQMGWTRRNQNSPLPNGVDAKESKFPLNKGGGREADGGCFVCRRKRIGDRPIIKMFDL